MTRYDHDVNIFLRIQLNNMESCHRSSLHFMILLLHFFFSNAVYSVIIVIPFFPGCDMISSYDYNSNKHENSF